MYQISSKSDNVWLRYGDFTIFKMAAVRHLAFWKFAVFVMWPLSPWCSAFCCKISLISDYRLMSYFQDGVRRHLEFQKFQFLVTWLKSGLISDVVYHISSKFDSFWLRYGDLTIFKMAAVAILDFRNLQFLSCRPRLHAALLSRTKFRWTRPIGRWVMAKKAIFKMAAAAILN